MSSAATFFTSEEKIRIKTAILKAELDTSGEIRVHIENHCITNILDRASYVFKELKMNETALRNGVLIYLAIKDHQFAIIGDSGINQKVEETFWEDIKTLMSEYFRQGDFVGGIEKGIEQTGKKLKKYFPFHVKDINELSDEISFG
ncbi:MAG: TPM domain-containing protein [Lentimicrobiaceae bacterium]|jgi:uncharacterized membrane protein|nr:TPM domain-containing protein [Lentimicrobiaceae bacterium]